MNIPHHAPKFLSTSISFYENINPSMTSGSIFPEKSKTEIELSKLNGEKYKNIITSLNYFKNIKREYIIRLQSLLLDSQVI